MSSLGGYRPPRDTGSHWGALVLGMVVIGGLFWLLPVALYRQETADCVKWQGWAAEYPAFYLTPDEAEQCTAHNITINAPVKR